MAAQSQTDLFDAYFRKADLDGDGQISGAEAVAFFQGSILPNQVLAQVISLFFFIFFLHIDNLPFFFSGS
ncbi:hypothetical protein GQ457_10G015550 [Hibiscus cannabinus]